jgi:hypothetical protein
MIPRARRILDRDAAADRRGCVFIVMNRPRR